MGGGAYAKDGVKGDEMGGGGGGRFPNKVKGGGGVAGEG